MATNDIDNWTPIAEAVELTGKSDRTLRRWVTRQKLPSKKIKGRLYLDLSSLDLPSGQIDNDKVDSDRIDQTDYDNDRIKLAKLQAENERLNSEVDYLRQALAAALSKIPAIEASTSLDQSPTRRWWEFWK